MSKEKTFVSQEYSSQQGGKNIKEGTGAGRVLSYIATTAFAVAVIIGVSLIAFTVCFFFSDVNGSSMMRTLNASGANTDSVVVNKYQKAKVGDIIILNHYKANGQFASLHIKRLVAVGGEWVCFVPYIDENDHKRHFRIEVNGVDRDPMFRQNNAQIYIDNISCEQYESFYNWQQGGEYYYAPNRGEDSPFNDKDENGYDFREFNVERNRKEVLLPAGYIFYMGDNRAGRGGSYINRDVINPRNLSDEERMSIDSTYFGPVFERDIVGVVVDIVTNKTAPEWLFDKIIYYITFGLVVR